MDYWPTEERAERFVTWLHGILSGSDRTMLCREDMVEACRARRVNEEEMKDGRPTVLKCPRAKS
ncbi:hypothetical protein MES4922_180074 [Mesorhizobium ventifaucium]|uniref:DUF982 domain-containing protein n=1 Tax=Mesorhizobium ventifaucium TaxID=666020 RepID=A0ABM9DK14_9HYPH|nr:hypothetical protein MES4922_180074 [Mesorhizobium ventifaucium]